MARKPRLEYPGATYHVCTRGDNKEAIFLSSRWIRLLSTIMHSVNSSYVKYFNRTHQKTGHLFQDRYRAVVVETDAHLLEATRYIHLNPTVAGITDESYQIQMEQLPLILQQYNHRTTQSS